MRDVAPGAVAAAVAWQLLQSFGVSYVRHVIKHASATNAVFGIVLGALAFLYIAAVAVLLCVEINVIRVNRLHPRALLTPFTNNVSLTSGDRRVYAREAKAQRSKGFERVDVTFDQAGRGSRAGAGTGTGTGTEIRATAGPGAGTEPRAGTGTDRASAGPEPQPSGWALQRARWVSPSASSG